MSKDTSGPAFPLPGPTSDMDWLQKNGLSGISMRDYFAAKAMAALLSDGTNPACKSRDPEGIERERRLFADEIAIAAYRFADAMLKAREA